MYDIDGLVEDCGISSVFAMEIPKSLTKPWMYKKMIIFSREFILL